MKNIIKAIIRALLLFAAATIFSGITVPIILNLPVSVFIMILLLLVDIWFGVFILIKYLPKLEKMIIKSFNLES